MYTSLLLLFSLAHAAATPAIKALSFGLTKHNRTKSARSSSLRARDGDFSQAAENESGIYGIQLYYGSQQAAYTAMIDTGSADTWINTAVFDPSDSTTFNNLTTSFSICYAGGSCVSGYFGTDNVLVGSANVSQAQFALVENPEGDPILGLGYKNTETSTTWDGETSENTYDNFPYAMKNSGLIEQAAYSVWLNSASTSDGSLIFGGIDTSKYTGTLGLLPSVRYEITENGETFIPADPTDITVVCSGVSLLASNGTRVDVVTNAGLGALLDVGTTSTSLPKDWLVALGTALGAEWNDDLGAMASTEVITEGSIVFDFSGVTIEMPLDNNVWIASSLNGESYTQDGAQVYNINIDAADEGVSASSVVIFGQVFLQHAFVVIDLDAQQIALAQAATSVSADETLVTIDSNGIPSATSASGYSSSTLFTSYSLTTPGLIGTPTTPS